MLEQSDIKKIGEEMGKVIEQNINPQFEEMRGRFDIIETRVDGLDSRLDGLDNRMNGLDGRLDGLDKTVANLPTKAYIDDTFADLEGSMVARQRKEDQKVNRLIAFLADNKTINEKQVAELHQFRVFPAPPKVG